MFDCEKLIMEVESRPFLWNMGLHDYHDSAKRKLGWRSVAEALHANWNELSIKDQDEIGRIFKL